MLNENDRNAEQLKRTTRMNNTIFTNHYYR